VAPRFLVLDVPPAFGNGIATSFRRVIVEQDFNSQLKQVRAFRAMNCIGLQQRVIVEKCAAKPGCSQTRIGGRAAGMLTLFPDDRIAPVEFDSDLRNKIGVEIVNMLVPFDHLVAGHSRKQIAQCPIDR
jgi:hypothetical protein